ncbi:hypothetical protein Y032_0509g2720 [Ancylostoma ceylanicum]|uniref:Tetraspanin family protein n=1 Tax=Ancylostoma ceylanicum TaxID=53326 RepID=A0A016WTM0_9BILA|nr:hypothetical protein Y032_0509g2720 [Ancylostoma ceylanicum]
MPQRLERTARALSLCLNTLFFLLSIFLIALVCLAAINPPKPDISPQPLNSYPQYIITIALIASYSCCLFLLSSFGFISICLPGSFLMSLHILGQIAIICAQLIAVAFTITVRKRLHLKLEESWQGRPGCAKVADCLHVQRFMRSETQLIIILCVFLLLQVVLLITSSIVCEHRSHSERQKLLKQHEEEEDDY